jgi:hypothetical protein
MHGQIGTRHRRTSADLGEFTASDGTRRLSDGSIDYAFYRADADRQRLAVMQAFWRRLGKMLKVACAGLLAAGSLFRVPPL